TEDNTFKMMEVLNKDRIEDIIDDIKNVYNNVRTVAMSFEEVKDKTINYINSLEVKEEDIEEVKEILIYLMDRLGGNSKISKLKSKSQWIEFYNNDYKKDEIYTYIEYIQDNLGSSKKELEKQNRLKELLSEILLGKEKENLWLYKSILNVLIDIDKIYDRLKREEGGLDYNDLQNNIL